MYLAEEYGVVDLRVGDVPFGKSDEGFGQSYG